MINIIVHYVNMLQLKTFYLIGNSKCSLESHFCICIHFQTNTIQYYYLLSVLPEKFQTKYLKGYYGTQTLEKV